MYVSRQNDPVLDITYDVQPVAKPTRRLNFLNAQLNPICHLRALLGAHHILYVSRVGVKGYFNPLNAELIPSAKCWHY